MTSYDRFPRRVVALCAGVSILIYALGAALIAPLGAVFAALYILYCLLLELRVCLMSCRDCFYYGKRCAFGKGKLGSRLFAKGSPGRFKEKKISWMHLMPDFLVSLIPLAAGVFLLAHSFAWPRLILVAALAILAFPVTGFVRSSIACAHCRQREIGCPAMQLFEKKGR